MHWRKRSIPSAPRLQVTIGDAPLAPIAPDGGQAFDPPGAVRPRRTPPAPSPVLQLAVWGMIAFAAIVLVASCEALT